MPEIWFPHLNIEIEHLSKVAFTVLGVQVYWYGILIGLGAIAGVLVASWKGKKFGYNLDVFGDFIFYAMISAIIGARIYYVVFSWDNYKNNLTTIFSLRQGGLAIYGGIIGAGICMYFYTKKRKYNFLEFLDVTVIGLAIGQAIGRWGNFFNREAYGGYTDSLFAMRILKEDAYTLTPSLLENIINVNGAEYIQVHPTFLYESFSCIIIFFVLCHVINVKTFNGQVALTYFFLYGLIRFFIEGLRTDQLLIGSTSIPVSQVVSLMLVVVSVILYINLKKQGAENIA